MHACTLWCPLARDNDQELIPGTHWSLNYAHSERSWVPNKVGLERCLLNKVINKVTGGELRIIHTALQGWTCEFNYSAYEHDALLPEVILISCRHSDLWPMTSTSFSTQLPLTGYFLFWDHSLESSSGQKQPCSPCSKSLAVPFFSLHSDDSFELGQVVWVAAMWEKFRFSKKMSHISIQFQHAVRNICIRGSVLLKKIEL